ncbi:MAG: hypothetical protein AAB949_00920 [Patescibacteria group bacterium]
MAIEQPEEQSIKPSVETEKKPEIPEEILSAKEKKWEEWAGRAFKSDQEASQEAVLQTGDEATREQRERSGHRMTANQEPVEVTQEMGRQEQPQQLQHEQQEQPEVVPESDVEEKPEQEIESEEQSSKSSGAWKFAGAVAKGAWKTAGSVFGFRVVEETAKLGYDIISKGKQKKELVLTTREIAENVLEVRRLTKERLANADGSDKEKGEIQKEKEEMREATNPVREKIRALNQKLAEANLPDSEKEQMRREITLILREYNHRSEEAEAEKRDKIKELTDLYINNKAQGMLVAKEALNTASIMLAQPYLRVLGYSGFAALERARKASETYNKAHFREGGSIGGKLKAAAKDLFINSAWETISDFNVFNKEKSHFKRGVDFVSSIGILLRFAGLAEYEYAIQTGAMVPAEGAKKLLEAVEEGKIGDALGQMGENWLGNAKRLLSIVGITEKEGTGATPTTVAEGEKIYQPTRYSYEEVKGMTDARPEAPSLEELARGQTQESLGWRVREQMENDQQAIASVFGEDSEIANKALEGGVTPQVLGGLAQKMQDAGLEPEKLKGFSPEQIEKLASAENIAVIKQGGSVSEALDLSMSPDATATVINPDGSVIENFDANLAHAGDTVARNADGSITVFKTSEVAVREGQSLAGVYRQIESVLNREKIPNEIKEVFNNGKGHWGGRIDRSEANRILEWWHDNKDGFGKMPPDAQKEFLSGLKGAHSKDELDRLLNEALSGAEGAKESAAPVAEAVAVEKAPLELPKEHDAALNEAVHNPEIRIESEDWPPKDSRSVTEKISSNAWDQDSKANERAGVTENVVFDSKASIRNKIAEIFHYKNNTELENIKEWSKVKTQQASDVMDGKFKVASAGGFFKRLFGKSEFSITDQKGLMILSQQRTLRGYLNELREKIPQVDPKGKNVETYLQEAERILSMKKAIQGEFSGTQELK